VPTISVTRERLSDGQGDRYTLQEQGRSLSVRDVLSRWQTDAECRTVFIDALVASPHRAYRWETPPMTSDRLDDPFEWVLIADPSLDRAPEPHIFRSYFRDHAADVVTFENLGGDALLVVPSPQATSDTYGHLAAFVRRAPMDQVHALWQTVGQVMEGYVGSAPRWLNTAGGGVAWLHVRLDARPKYYVHRPYKQWRERSRWR